MEADGRESTQEILAQKAGQERKKQSEKTPIWIESDPENGQTGAGNVMTTTE